MKIKKLRTYKNLEHLSKNSGVTKYFGTFVPIVNKNLNGF